MMTCSSLQASSRFLIDLWPEVLSFVSDGVSLAVGATMIPQLTETSLAQRKTKVLQSPGLILSSCKPFGTVIHPFGAILTCASAPPTTPSFTLKDCKA